MTGWRLHALMLGGAALVGALVALVLSGGFGSSVGVARASPSGSARITRSASPTVRATPSPTPAESPSPSPSSSGTPDLSTLVRPASSVRLIAGTTLLLSMTGGLDGTTFVAVPLSATSPRPSGSPRPSPTIAASAPVTLGTVGPSAGSALRADGVLLAISLATEPDSARIALWDLRTSAVSWLTPDEPDIRNVTPLWSADGSLLYYASSASRPGTTDLGVWRIRADGTQRTLVRRPVSGGSTVTLVGLTPDGAGLVFSMDRAGGSAHVLDLRTGTDRAFDDPTAASVVAWRDARPRALVAVGGGAGQPAGTLVLWDDIADTKKVLLGPTITGSPDGILGADFDPTGTRIVIAASAKIGEIQGSALDLIDLNGANRTLIPGTAGAEQVLWFRAGIVFTRTSAGGGTDVLLIPPTGGTPVTVYSAPGAIGKLTFVSP